MKKLILLSVATIAAGCGQPGNSKSATSSTKTDLANKNKYVFTLNAYDFNDPKKPSEVKPFVDTLYEVNDTVAYLSAVKKWYGKKIDEKAGVFHGLIQSYNVVDKNGLDLAVKLGPNIVTGINNQVEQMPDVRKYIEQAQQDSLVYNSFSGSAA
jgi:hypothetical protein